MAVLFLCPVGIMCRFAPKYHANLTVVWLFHGGNLTTVGNGVKLLLSDGPPLLSSGRLLDR